jgi:polyferredoxin
MGKYNIWLRRVSQGLFLGLWIFLFYTTAHPNFGAIPPELFLKTDPLATLLTMASAEVWVSAMVWGLLLIGLTLVLGRFFCGWVCPLGTILDVVGVVWHGNKEKELEHDEAWRRVKYYLLALLCLGALAGGQLVYWGDPLVILFRGITFGAVLSAPGAGSFLALFLLLVIIGLVGVTHRFWCRYLCPLGALYGVFARFSIFRRHLKGCDRCKDLDARECQQHCPVVGSVSRQGRPDECIRCMSCQAVCHKSGITFEPAVPLPSKREVLVDLERRTFVVTMGAGAVSGFAAANARLGDGKDWRIVRPPMVADPMAFNALCVRCGQCVRSCPTGTLQPLLLEGGFAGLWTPAVTPAVGGCKDDCNACSVACATHAIPEFGPAREEKWTHKMGSVVFASHLCISYAEGAAKPCLKCVEACPNKAIIVDEAAEPARPRLVVYDRCVGCGTCETECLKMVSGAPAMTLNADGAGTPAVLVKDPTPVLPGDTPKEPPKAS